MGRRLARLPNTAFHCTGPRTVPKTQDRRYLPHLNARTATGYTKVHCDSQLVFGSDLRSIPSREKFSKRENDSWSSSPGVLSTSPHPSSFGRQMEVLSGLRISGPGPGIVPATETVRSVSIFAETDWKHRINLPNERRYVFNRRRSGMCVPCGNRCLTLAGPIIVHIRKRDKWLFSAYSSLISIYVSLFNFYNPGPHII